MVLEVKFSRYWKSNPLHLDHRASSELHHNQFVSLRGVIYEPGGALASSLQMRHYQGVVIATRIGCHGAFHRPGYFESFKQPLQQLYENDGFAGT